MAITITKPTVGGSEDTWGTTINTALDTIVDAANGTSGTLAPNLSTLTIGGTDITATAAQLNYVDGVTSSIQTQLDAKAPLASPTFTGTAVIPTVDATTVEVGGWTVTEDASNNLLFKIGSTTYMKLDSSGNLTVRGDVTAKDTSI